MGKIAYKSVDWLACQCPQCGHWQEAEADSYAARGALCEFCGKNVLHARWLAERAMVRLRDPLPDELDLRLQVVERRGLRALVRVVNSHLSIPILNSYNVSDLRPERLGRNP